MSDDTPGGCGCVLMLIGLMALSVGLVVALGWWGLVVAGAVLLLVGMVSVAVSVIANT